MKRPKQIHLRLKTLVVLMLLSLGCYQLATGLYIFAKAKVAQILIGYAWQQTLIDQQNHRPWPWADTYPIARLQFNTSQLFVLAGANGRNLAFGPSHVSYTALPGHIGHSVIVGHRDTQFNGLKNLKLGDMLSVTTQTKHSRYRIENLQVVEANQLSFWQPNKQQSNQLTLVTCYPVNSIQPHPTQRYIVTARLL